MTVEWLSNGVRDRRIAGVSFALILAGVLAACQVPVFRYALERWQPDHYQLLVLCDRELTETEAEQVDQLRQRAGRSSSSSSVSSNFDVRIVRTDQSENRFAKVTWEQHGSRNQPLLAVMYPENAQEIPDPLAGTFRLSSDAIDNVTRSPVRTEIAKRLLSGQSAVWIFVPIGDPDQDDECLATLQREVQRNQDSLELPEQEEVEGEEALLAEVDIELRLEFSIITLNRDDPKEKFLLDLLLSSEPDLADLKQPMAFPVLGRGRVLYALVGKGIAEDTIGIASRFIIGPCSCQVKNQNPGFDLLMNCNWDEEIGTAKLSEEIPSDKSPPVKLSIPPGKKK
ncbi:hypothetical protein [Planctomycetes bacterium K23_9]